MLPGQTGVGGHQQVELGELPGEPQPLGLAVGEVLQDGSGSGSGCPGRGAVDQGVPLQEARDPGHAGVRPQVDPQQPRVGGRGGGHDHPGAAGSHLLTGPGGQGDGRPSPGGGTRETGE